MGSFLKWKGFGDRAGRQAGRRLRRVKPYRKEEGFGNGEELQSVKPYRKGRQSRAPAPTPAIGGRGGGFGANARNLPPTHYYNKKICLVKGYWKIYLGDRKVKIIFLIPIDKGYFCDKI
jgi:hypothetical protein